MGTDNVLYLMMSYIFHGSDGIYDSLFKPNFSEENVTLFKLFHKTWFQFILKCKALVVPKKQTFLLTLDKVGTQEIPKSD